MGWKNVKDHYRIEHIVCVNSKGICIGSAYVHDLIVISPAGDVRKPFEYTGSNEDLERYMREMQGDPERLRQLVLAPDTFSRSIPVFTYSGGEIVEEQCEELGWPNVTHLGHLMYENKYSPDKQVVVGWAKANAELAVKCARNRVRDVELQLVEARESLSQAELDRAKLEKEFPQSENRTAETR